MSKVILHPEWKDRVSIILPVWFPSEDHRDMVKKNLERIREVQSIQTEVVLVSNGNGFINTISVEPLLPLVDYVVYQDKNYGISNGWNTGQDYAMHPIRITLSGSVYVQPGWDKALAEVAAEGAIAFPFTNMGEGYTIPDTAGVAGWCFAMSVWVWEQVGDFDEWFSPSFYEDTDYWHRAYSCGIPLITVESARVDYQRRRTNSHLNDWKLLFLAHRLKYAWKHNLNPDEPPPFYKRDIIVRREG